MKSETGPSERVRGMDGMRGLAASAVVVSHFGMPDTPLGRVSVAAFFTLSGYLLLGQLHRFRKSIEAGRNEPLSAFVSFWVSRALRLTPVYLIVLALAYAVERAHGYIYLRESMEWYLFSIQNFYVAFVQPFWLSYSHTWAIAAQNQFYLIVCIPALFLLPSSKHAGFYEILVIACLLIDGSMVWNGVDPQSVRLLPQWGGVFMALGGVLALRGAPAASPMLRNAAVLSVFAIVLLVVRPVIHHVVEGVFGLIVMAFFMYSLVSYVLANPNAFVVRALETRVFKHLGHISYELYLVHVPVALFGVKAVNELVDYVDLPGVFLDKTLQFTVFYGISLLIATVLHYGVQVSIDEKRRGIVEWFAARVVTRRREETETAAASIAR